MALTVSVGLSKKMGLPNYGSLGASCNVQFELDASLLQTDPAALQQQVRNSYSACAQAVNDELARQQGPTQNLNQRAADSDTNGSWPSSHATNGNGVSDKQLNYARQLASQIRGLGVRRLETLADKMFAKPVAELSTLEGSGLIDALKSIKAGEINLDNALNGAAA